MHADSHAFLTLARDKSVLRFGRYQTKAGRDSPYFFNAGLFDDGASFGALCGFYAGLIQRSGVEFDMLFGPAYKGISLAAGIAMRLADQGRTVGFASNRKEAKDHGEGGQLLGAPLAGKVLIVDDVISAGTSVGESMRWIRAAGAQAAGVVVALDRMERAGSGTQGAVEQVRQEYGIPVYAIATLEDLLAWLADEEDLQAQFEAVQNYRNKYGTSFGQHPD